MNVSVRPIEYVVVTQVTCSGQADSKRSSCEHRNVSLSDVVQYGPLSTVSLYMISVIHGHLWSKRQ